jgi:acyl-coenzyme A synthetase/AMP-(fatty) acid ligase
VFHRIVEEAIYEHSAVAEVTVIGIPDPYRGQSANTFIALKPGHAPFGIDELKAFLADREVRDADRDRDSLKPPQYASRRVIEKRIAG